MVGVKRMMAGGFYFLIMIWWWSKLVLHLLLGRDQRSRMFISFFLGVLEAHSMGRYVGFMTHYKRPFQANSSSAVWWLPETVNNPLFEQSQVCQMSFITYEADGESEIPLPGWIDFLARIFFAADQKHGEER